MYPDIVELCNQEKHADTRTAAGAVASTHGAVLHCCCCRCIRLGASTIAYRQYCGVHYSNDTPQQLIENDGAADVKCETRILCELCFAFAFQTREHYFTDDVTIIKAGEAAHKKNTK